MSKTITIADLAKSVKLTPKQARSIARRKLGKKAPKGRWEFTPTQAKAVRKVLAK